MDDKTLEEYRELLLQYRQMLEDLTETRDEASSTVELDQARTGRVSRIDALQGQEMAKAGQARAKMELQKISAALERIDDGSYGECLECGEEIAAGRLSTNPAITLCIQCAEAKESG